MVRPSLGPTPGTPEIMAALSFLILANLICTVVTLKPIVVESQILWQANTDEIRLFRTPILLSLPNGHLLAFAEARKYSTSDSGAKFLAMKRSTDQGWSWKSSVYIFDDYHAQDGMNLGAALYDYDTNTIFVLYSYCGHLANCTPGPDTDEYAGTYMISSHNYGYSWSRSVNMLDITPNVTSLEPVAFGPGYGIQKKFPPHKGRLVACGHTSQFTVRTMLCMYSDDHGKSWSINERFYSIPYNGTKIQGDLVPGEVQFVELPNGTLFMTVRNSHSYRCNCRIQMKSFDGGETFPLRYIFFDEALVDPNCFASMLLHDDLLFFSNPFNAQNRTNMTVRWSTDYGSSWIGLLPIYGGSSAYSCLSSIDSNYIGLLYEKDDEYISFVKLKLYE